MNDLEKRAEEYACKEVYYGAYVDDEAGREIAEEVYIEATKRETKLLSKQLTEAKKIIHDLLQIGVFQFPFQDDEANCLNKQITAKAEAFLKEKSDDTDTTR